MELESKYNETLIKCPRVEAYKKKDGHYKPGSCKVLTIESILKSVKKACELAKEMIKDLGMGEML